MALDKALLVVFAAANIFGVVASDCPKTNYTEMSGTLQSPGYSTPSSYGQNSSCTYNINVAAGYRVELEFTRLSVLGTMPDCKEDSVEIFVGCDKTSIGKFCSCSDLSIPRKIYSRDECMMLVFNSDASKNAEGFEAKYAAVKNDTPVDPSSNCSNTDQRSPNGTLFTPRWPLDFTPDLKCSWLLNPPAAKVVRMFFMSLQLDEQDQGCDPSGSAFSGDEIRINGTNTTGSHVDIESRICSPKELAKMYFPIQEMKIIQVRFAASPSQERSGFIAGYATYSKGSLNSASPGCKALDEVSTTVTTTTKGKGNKTIKTSLAVILGALMIAFAADLLHTEG